MGRTFLDIDMARAADLLGMERRQAEAIRDLQRGEFLALGPALSRRPVNVKIGPVRTQARSSSPKLVPLPSADADFGDLFSGLADAPPPPPPPPVPRPTPAEDMLRALESAAESPRPDQARNDLPEVDEETRARIIESALAGVVAESGSQPLPVLYQDFGVRCRMLGLPGQALDLPAFRRRLAMAKAGIRAEEEGWEGALALADVLPEDMHPVLLLLARAARDGAPCPTDEDLAGIYGTTSTSRLRRVLSFMEEQNIIVARIDLSGKRSVSLPTLGWTTAPSLAEHERPQARVARRR
jgi:hypothetical protein